MKKTFEEFVKEIGLTSAIIICYRDTEEVPTTRFGRGQRSMRPDLPEGILDRLSFEDWMRIIRDPHLRSAENLHKIGHMKASELASTPEQCKDYLRYFDIRGQQDRDVLERLIFAGNHCDLREVRHRIPLGDSLLEVWMTRFIASAREAKEENKFNYWLDVCEKTEPNSPERRIALFNMCELEGLSVS